jgi:hypothetical protein
MRHTVISSCELSSFAYAKFGSDHERRVAVVRAQQLEDGSMNLLRSICCLFAGRCAEEEPKPRKETVRGDLGQTDAELEKAGKERMEHMEGEKPK